MILDLDKPLDKSPGKLPARGHRTCLPEPYNGPHGGQAGTFGPSRSRVRKPTVNAPSTDRVRAFRPDRSAEKGRRNVHCPSPRAAPHTNVSAARHPRSSAPVTRHRSDHIRRPGSGIPGPVAGRHAPTGHVGRGDRDPGRALGRIASSTRDSPAPDNAAGGGVGPTHNRLSIGKLVYSNPAAEKILGRAGQTSGGRPCESVFGLIHPDDLEAGRGHWLPSAVDAEWPGDARRARPACRWIVPLAARRGRQTGPTIPPSAASSSTSRT